MYYRINIQKDGKNIPVLELKETPSKIQDIADNIIRKLGKGATATIEQKRKILADFKPWLKLSMTTPSIRQYK